MEISDLTPQWMQIPIASNKKRRKGRSDMEICDISTKAVKSLITVGNEAITIGDARQTNRHKNPHNRKTAAGAWRHKLLMLFRDGQERARDVGVINPPLE